MDRIQKISTYLIKFLHVLLFALPVIICIQWIWIDSDPIKGWVEQGLLLSRVEFNGELYNLAHRPWTPLTKTLGLFGSGIGSLPLFLGLLVLISLFKNYMKGDIFTPSTIRCYKQLGLLFFFDGLVAKLLSGMFMILAVSFTNPPGQRFLTLTFGTPNLEVIFCGILLVVVSWVMNEGYKIREEQQYTV